MQNKTNEGQKVVSPVFNRVAKWAIFVLNRARVWRPRRHMFTQTFLEPPLGGHWAADWAMQWLNILINKDYKDTFSNWVYSYSYPVRWDSDMHPLPFETRRLALFLNIAWQYNVTNRNSQIPKIIVVLRLWHVTGSILVFFYNSIFTVMFCFVKLLKKIAFQFHFCRILPLKPF